MTKTESGIEAEMTVERTLRARAARVMNAAQGRGFDALVVAGRGAIGEYGYLEYLSGYAPAARFAYAILTAGGEPVVIMPTSADRYLAAAKSGLDVRVAGIGDVVGARDELAAAVVEVLRERGVDGGTIGLVGLQQIIPVGPYRTLVEGLPDATIGDATGILSSIKSVKDADEIAEVEAAVAIADAGLEIVAQGLRAGATGWELNGGVEREIRRHGARHALIFLSARPYFIGAPENGPFREGDLVTAYVELTSASGYWVELARLFAIGELDPGAAALAQACIDAADDAERALGAGRPVADVATAIDARAAAAGAESGIWHGHGVGIDHDVPVITSSASERFDENAVIAIHPNFRSEAVEPGASVADTYVVTSSGCRRLSTTPRELRTVA